MRRLLISILLTLSFVSGRAAGTWPDYIQRYPEFAAQLESMDKHALKDLYQSFLLYEQLGALSANCYPDDPAAGIPDGWVMVGPDTAAGALVSRYNNGSSARSSGFHAELYRKVGSQPFYSLAFAGTDDILDVFGADLFGALRADETQTRLSKELVGEMVRILPDTPLWLTGHSLGGRLALEAGVEYMLPAVVFNPASLSRDTKRVLSELSGKSAFKRMGRMMRTSVTLSLFTAIYAVADGEGSAVSIDTGKIVSSLGEGLSDMWNDGDILGGLSKIGSGAVESLEGDLLDALQRNETVSGYIGEEVSFGRVIRLRHAGYHKIGPLYEALRAHREMIALRLQMM